MKCCFIPTCVVLVTSLYNVIFETEPTTCESENPWSIIFEIREEGDGLDYRYDKGEGDAGDVAVYSHSFVWNDL
mgnify:CR=1 FL=1